MIKVTRAPSKTTSLVGQGNGVSVGSSVGWEVNVGGTGVGVAAGDWGKAVAAVEVEAVEQKEKR